MPQYNLTDCSIRVSRFFNGIVQSTDFFAVKALLSPQNERIIPDSYSNSFFWHNHYMPGDK